jgi:[ribosomal protein S5]-alanine N-acetyltransferase
MTPRLETPRLILRPFVSGDWPTVNAMVSNPEAIRYMHFAHWTEEQRRRWFDWCVTSAEEAGSETMNWAICRKEAGDVIGWFGIGGASRPAVPGERSFGYLLDPAFWNQGYMTEALRAVLRYEFTLRGTPQVRATCETANVASLRVMEKAGMHLEKTVYDADFEGNRAHRHHSIMTRAEYEALA